jgi:hypothetical protein
LRSVSILLTFIFVLLAGQALAQPDNQLVGAWEFVSGTYTHGDGTTSEESSQEGVSGLKILSETHFCLIAKWKDGTMNNALGGTYKVEGGSYTENIEYAAYEANLGLKGEFKFRLENDLLQIEGKVGKAKLKEVWRRVH